jgi:rare lipoprotein A
MGGTMGAAPGHNRLTTLEIPKFQPIPAKRPEALEAEKAPYQVGNASWYGGFFQGQETANGEDYDMYGFTAAHRELPLGTFVKVTNLKNLRTIVVRINDRGPVTPGRIIDLSFAAARSLGMHQKGLQKVRIDIVDRQTAEMAMAQQPVIH